MAVERWTHLGSSVGHEKKYRFFFLRVTGGNERVLS